MTQAEGVPAEPLRFGLSLMNFDDFAEARRVADLARVAEDAGWEALLVWDHLGFVWGTPSGDPWTLVTAAALATERLLVGTDVAVIARERPLPFANRSRRSTGCPAGAWSWAWGSAARRTSTARRASPWTRASAPR